MTNLTEQEIDLRPYFNALKRNAIWIILATVAAMVVGYLVSAQMAPTYRASALIAIRQPRYTLEFDPRIQIENEDVRSVYDALPILATSDELLIALIEQEPFLRDAGVTVQGLRGRLAADPLAKPTLIQLAARSKDPAQAAQLVNVWAALLVQRANAVYAGQGAGQAEFFDMQVEEAEKELGDAQAALEEFASRNQGNVLNNQLEALLEAQAAYLQSQSLLALLIQDVQSLQTQLDAQSADLTTTQADQLAALLLQIRAFNGQAEIPLQIQLGGDGGLESRTVAQQKAYLADLVNTLGEKSAEIDARVAEITPQILELQQQIQAYQTEETKLQDAVDIARETHTILARKAEEAGIAVQDSSGLVQLASQAATPENPASPNKLLNTIAAGALGFLVATTAVLLLQGYTGNHSDDQSGQEKAE